MSTTHPRTGNDVRVVLVTRGCIQWIWISDYTNWRCGQRYSEPWTGGESWRQLRPTRGLIPEDDDGIGGLSFRLLRSRVRESVVHTRLMQYSLVKCDVTLNGASVDVAWCDMIVLCTSRPLLGRRHSRLYGRRLTSDNW